MAKKSRSSRGKRVRAHHTQRYVNRYKKPRWMKIVKSITIVIVSIVLILSIIGMIIHLISHYK